jgi:hypothetical protein
MKKGFAANLRRRDKRTQISAGAVYGKIQPAGPDVLKPKKTSARKRMMMLTSSSVSKKAKGS